MSDFPNKPPASFADTKIYIRVILISLVLFFALATLVQLGTLKSFDSAVLTSIDSYKNSLSNIEHLDEFMRDCTSLGGSTLLTLLTSITVIYLLWIKQNFKATFLATAVVTSSVLNNALKHIFDLPRPDLFPHGMLVHSATFPSGHTLTGTVAYLSIALLISEFSISATHKIYTIGVAVLLSFLLGFSRLYLQVHWPSDIIAGWVLGVAWAALCRLIAGTMETGIKP